MEIDPIRYGVMYQKVEDYDRRIIELGVKIDKMEKSLNDLVALANQSKGGLWVGKAVAGLVSGVIVLIAEKFFK